MTKVSPALANNNRNAETGTWSHAPANRRDQPMSSTISDHDETNSLSPSDEELMLDIQQQGSVAFEELYRRHHVLLQGVMMRVLQSESDSQDLLQALFVAIWNGGSLQYRPEKGRPLGWLITMTRRRAIDLVRKQVSYRKMCDSFEAESLVRPHYSSGTLEREINSAEYRILIANALDRLPKAQRVAVELSFFNGLSQRDISARLGVPVGTIKTRLHLALNKVRRHLSGVSRELENAFGKPLPV